MPKPRFRPNVRGFNEAMKSPAVSAELHRLGQGVADDAGDGFQAVSDNTHPWVAREFIQPATPAAHRLNNREQVILRALGNRLG